MPLFRVLIVFFLTLFPFLIQAQNPDINFRHLTAADGISHSFIRNILQDHEGYIWLATPNGLNKYNGYSATIYKSSIKKKNKLFCNDVWELFEDSENNLWVGTRQGLARYLRDQDTFIQDTSIANIHIRYIFEDKTKGLWVIADNKLYRYHKSKGFLPFQIKGLTDKVNCLYQDKYNRFFIGTEKGVYRYDSKNNQATFVFNLMNVNSFYEDNEDLWIGSKGDGIVVENMVTGTKRIYRNDRSNPESINTNDILRINGDGKYVYIGTEDDGLIVFDKKNRKFYNYLNDPSNPGSISFNSIYSIMVDNDKTVWIGTFSGVDIINRNKFKLIRHKVGVVNTLSHNNILCFTEDREGNIWIGTDGGGLNKYDRTNNTFKVYKSIPTNPKGLNSNAVTYLKEDRDGNLWVGTWAGGLHLMNKATGEFTIFTHDANDSSSIISSSVVAIEEDKDGNLWLGTDQGVDFFNKQSRTFTHYSTPENHLMEYISEIYQDKQGNIWVGTFSGLFLLDKQTKKTTAFLHNEADNHSISSNVIFSISEDSKGNFWVCSLGGLNLFNKQDKTFTTYREIDGLPADAVENVLEDQEGNLWLASTGLSRFNPRTGTFKNFNISDGLQDNEFKQNAYCKLKSGEFLYGGPHGFNIFNPSSIRENHRIPPVVLTDFHIFNGDVPIGTPDSPLKKHISQTREIELSYKQSVFSIDFAALNFIATEKNEYAYKLEGLENQWNYVGNKRSATYTNLDPGKYIFRVKASNNDGYWNEEGVSLTIVVTPPYWKTWWFKLLITLLVVGVFMTIYFYRLNIIEQQKKILEEQVKQRTAELNEQAKSLRAANKELNDQKEEIFTQREQIQNLYLDIKDSIRAAQDIQQIIFPSSTLIEQHLGNHFILNRPKDVVSGDFYWFNSKGNKIFFATADCTGHGVSGAFMAIHGHHLLNKASLSNVQPKASEVLNQLNEGVLSELNNDHYSEFSMDISFCVLDKDAGKLEYAGANGGLYMVREGQLIQIKGDKFSIGLSIPQFEAKYRNHEIEVKPGDTFYLFSDGYADQLGGINGNEKFLYSRFRELILEINSFEMEIQKQILEKRLLEWKGNVEQVDDILIVGFKI